MNPMQWGHTGYGFSRTKKKSLRMKKPRSIEEKEKWEVGFIPGSSKRIQNEKEKKCFFFHLYLSIIWGHEKESQIIVWGEMNKNETSKGVVPGAGAFLFNYT